ncbi:hypothetical protein PBRA_002994 [Plasmodiophora brassicae]|uniref:Uncharacterized protein n=1 Tax=Plasmodiophora brassicae TaxID=37360 RepID=A0A0G4J7A1_PLABS|nr:hypothetical protein PBRA_002994 [Plasmodiophora brassicae]
MRSLLRRAPGMTKVADEEAVENAQGAKRQVHHAPGGASQCPFGREDTMAPATPIRRGRNSSQMSQVLSTPGRLPSASFEDASGNIVRRSSEEAMERAGSSPAVGKSRPEQHTSIKIFHAPGGHSRIQLGGDTSAQERDSRKPAPAPKESFVSSAVPNSPVVGKARPDEHTSVKIHYAPGGYSSMASLLGQDDSTAPTRESHVRPNNVQREAVASQAPWQHVGSKLDQTLSPIVEAHAAPSSSAAPDVPVVGKARPDEHTSVKIYYAPGGYSSMASLIGQDDSSAPDREHRGRRHYVNGGRPDTTTSNGRQQETGATVQSELPEARPASLARTSTRVRNAPGGSSNGNILTWQ